MTTAVFSHDVCNMMLNPPGTNTYYPILVFNFLNIFKQCADALRSSFAIKLGVDGM